MTATAGHQKGFTLLEMLLAIVLLSLLAGLAYGTLGMGVRAWEAAEQKAEQTDAMAVAWPYLHQVLEGTLPLPATEGRGLRFDGGTQALSWTAEVPSHLASGGVRTLRLFVHDDDQDTRQLKLAYQHLDDDGTQAPPDNQTATLVDRLSDIRIRYYGPYDNDTVPGWRDDWQQQPRLPLLIRIDITPEDAAPWPSLYAQLRLAHRDKQPTDSAEGQD